MSELRGVSGRPCGGNKSCEDDLQKAGPGKPVIAVSLEIWLVTGAGGLKKGCVLVADFVIEHHAVTRALVWSITWFRNCLSSGPHAASQRASQSAQTTSVQYRAWEAGRYSWGP